MIRVLAERVRDERKEIHKRVANGRPYVISKEFFPRLIQREGETNKGYMYMRFHLLKWAKQAEIGKRINFHLSRHTFATLLLLEVKDLNMVRDMLGHSKIATTQRYAKVLDALKAESMNRMNKYRLLG
jgi:site-specific recombinase XerD